MVAEQVGQLLLEEGLYQRVLGRGEAPWLVRSSQYARPSLSSHLIDARGTVEPNVDPKGVESRLNDGIFLWLDIDSPTDDDFKLLHDLFTLHPLALEDSRKFGQRPKLESYDDFRFLVVYGAADDPERRSGLAPIEVHCFFSPKWLITVHKGECGVFEELRNQTHHRLQHYEEGLPILYIVVDELVDSFLPQLAELDDAIDQLEDTILTDPQPTALQQAITMKRQLVQLRKIVNPQRDLFSGVLSGRYDLPGMTEEHERYFRDIYDHLIRVAEQLDDYRDLASGVTDLYQSTVGNKMNLTMKQLGWVATFFLPLSFLSGFFGQNFPVLFGRYLRPVWTFWVFGIGLSLAAFILVLLWFLNSERGNLRLRMPDLPALPHRR